MGYLLIGIGALTALLGGVLVMLEKFGIKKLPGDILIQKGGATFYFPIGLMIVLSIVATIIANFFFKK